MDEHDDLGAAALAAMVRMRETTESLKQILAAAASADEVTTGAGPRPGINRAARPPLPES